MLSPAYWDGIENARKKARKTDDLKHSAVLATQYRAAI
jgi:hypothetical protein